MSSITSMRGLLCAGLGLFCVIAGAQNVNGSLNFDNCCSSAQEATAFAIAYATPLIAFENATAPYLTTLGTNRILSAPVLSGPSSQAVVRPNADTLYSVAFIDLSHDDLVLTVPEVNDGRYWIFPFLDPYGNDFADISIVNGSPAGDYLIRRADDAGVAPGLEINCANTTSSNHSYVGTVNFPTTYGSFNGRILVLKNDTSDLDIVHSYQNKLKLTTTPRTLSNPYLPQAPTLTPALVDTSNISTPALKALTLLARLGQYNQPEVVADRYRVGSVLGQAGIVNGGYRPPQGINLVSAASTANTASLEIFTSPSNLETQPNDWVLQNTTVQGNFGTDYASRYYIGVNGYAQLPATQGLYPLWTPGNLLGESLSPQQAYLFTFFGLPPVDVTKGGFWSLTGYTAEGFLVPNNLGRYAIGDRTEGLHYSDGSLVYSGGSAVGSASTLGSNSTASANSTRQFQVLLQPADVPPPSNWTTNWLPAPSGGGNMSFTLRWFAPSEELLNGQYQYPLVQKVDAVSA